MISFAYCLLQGIKLTVSQQAAERTSPTYLYTVEQGTDRHS